jgi:hypothetical protein
MLKNKNKKVISKKADSKKNKNEEKLTEISFGCDCSVCPRNCK